MISGEFIWTRDFEKLDDIDALDIAVNGFHDYRQEGEAETPWLVAQRQGRGGMNLNHPSLSPHYRIKQVKPSTEEVTGEYSLTTFQRHLDENERHIASTLRVAQLAVGACNSKSIAISFSALPLNAVLNANVREGEQDQEELLDDLSNELSGTRLVLPSSAVEFHERIVFGVGPELASFQMPNSDVVLERLHIGSGHGAEMEQALMGATFNLTPDYSHSAHVTL